MDAGILTVAYSPLMPWWVIVAIGAIALAILVFGAVRRARGLILRGLAFAVGLAALANPSLIEEQRETLTDVAVIVADNSLSQNIGDRKARTEAALADLTRRLEALGNLEVRVVHAGNEANAEGTKLFAAIERALSDVPPERVAGAILITDGQVHDAPTADAIRNGAWRGTGDGPVHTLLTGHRNEGDRRVVVVRAPAYGVVGTDLAVTVRIEDATAAPGTMTVLSVVTDGVGERRIRLPVGIDADIPVTIEHGGPTVLELVAEPGRAELTLLNNRAAVVVNGVRDRLRVLLVSGEPHNGERTWRNLLKADPSVDLVHFTILRPPEKQDATPIRELSLIAFPVRQLFEDKLDDFDLIIFDRYAQRGVIPRIYLQNIADYVGYGGAVLVAAGPEDASPSLSLFTTPIAEVLPTIPTGRILTVGFRPQISDVGRRHPVTSDLLPPGVTSPTWGRWFRLIGAQTTGGTTVMEGENGQPLLVLDRVGEGRVAQLLSDQAWLWTRGIEGGGPQAELLRRLAHWLMKEPDLEEEALRAVGLGNRLEISRRTLAPAPVPSVTVTGPDGTEQTVALEPGTGGRSQGAAQVELSGLYRVTDGALTAIAAVGTLNPKENEDLRTTDAVLGPVAEATGGAVVWLAERAVPDVRRVADDREATGRTWIGLRDNESYFVTGVRETPLIPALLALALLIGSLVGAWYREGR
ncbi:MAG: hypothetical protein FJX64_11005 [Alphaproteobacteria bacterium]|nr:hypothetical protein [Alphaproteobacteria bacterium]